MFTRRKIVSMDKDIYVLVAKNIKYYRKKKNITQKVLADLTDFSYEYIRRIEAPNTPKYFSLNTIYIISKSLDIDIQKLFEERVKEDGSKKLLSK